LVEAAHPAALGELPLVAEHAEGDALRVKIQTDGKQKAPLEIEERQSQYAELHVTRLTEASFIVSRRGQGSAMRIPENQNGCRLKGKQGSGALGYAAAPRPASARFRSAICPAW